MKNSDEKPVALPSPNWKEELDYVPNEEGLNELKSAIKKVALPSSPARRGFALHADDDLIGPSSPAPTHNHQNVLDCGLGCPAGPIAMWPKYQGESVPSTPSPIFPLGMDYWWERFAEENELPDCETVSGRLTTWHYACLFAQWFAQQAAEFGKEYGVPSTPVETSE